MTRATRRGASARASPPNARAARTIAAAMANKRGMSLQPDPDPLQPMRGRAYSGCRPSSNATAGTDSWRMGGPGEITYASPGPGSDPSRGGVTSGLSAPLYTREGRVGFIRTLMWATRHEQPRRLRTASPPPLLWRDLDSLPDAMLRSWWTSFPRAEGGDDADLQSTHLRRAIPRSHSGPARDGRRTAGDRAGQGHAGTVRISPSRGAARRRARDLSEAEDRLSKPCPVCLH